ncbi:MAG: site-specific DNA-methyltransferase [Verrucomicrobiales bacterium]|nr:site-specific DNA-methyltransferase [Verrucomicrobiales bacterium]
MTVRWDERCGGSAALADVPEAGCDVVVLSVADRPGSPAGEAEALLAECARVVRAGGWLFVYGSPRVLPDWGVRLVGPDGVAGAWIFKYWIALELNAAPRGDFLQPAHQGLLMFLRKAAGSTRQPRFRLNTDTVRVPHRFCAACGKHLKDWGGKKHLMHPLGTAVSDVWRDLPRLELRSHAAPAVVLERIRALTLQENWHGLHVISPVARGVSRPMEVDGRLRAEAVESTVAAGDLEFDQVIEADCVEYLERLNRMHPGGVFDLVFADPPYNLAKSYDAYADARAEREYLEWCERWLDGAVRALRPGGSLFVLNLPKWALHHAVFLNARMEFRHWIAWDALSDPRGKLMPAHYALLYYTKPGGAPVFNYSPLGAPPDPECVPPPDAPKYCLRPACVRQRKRLGDDAKVELSDIWFDVHRIRHKRDRDAHPCQLPEKLLERIVRLASPPGGRVFDPFCGAGTTAIVAARLGRRFIVVDSDANYVRITRAKLAAMRQHSDLFGVAAVPRERTRRPPRAFRKKDVETRLQALARQLGRVPTEAEIQEADPALLEAIDRLYPYRSAALKRCRLALAPAGPTAG